MAYEPSPGSPIIELPDGRKFSVTTWIVDGIGLAGCGVMVWSLHQPGNIGSWSAEAWFAKWQAITPAPGVPDDQTLSWIIAKAGGPAPFVIDLMAFSSKALMQILGFAPAWLPSQSADDLIAALPAWEILSLVPGQFILPRPKG